MPPDVLLPTLLSQVLIAFTIEFEKAAEARGGRRPYATATARLLADPRAALPHHPLMLHRDGFPDGS